MFSINKIKTSLLAFGFVISVQAQADWALNSADSSLYYVTSKASAITEINRFTELSGAIDGSGNASLLIALNSIDTAIPTRDQRMRDIVFETAQYPQASVNVKIDAGALSAMSPGSSTRQTYDTRLSLHGMTETINAELSISKLEDGSVLVQSVKPVVFSAAIFGLAGAVEQLREIAGLPSINPNVVVNFRLLYQQAR
ncbi:MAG: YceI family protein [Pseudomonadales bacterium]|nr:YceI family protein [Pseudomonadales bacterium]